MANNYHQKTKFYFTKPVRIFLQIILISTGIAGLIHFGYAVWQWKGLLPVKSGYRVASNIHQDWYIDALPTAILLLASICILIAGLRRKMGGLLILIWALISTFIFFQYDISNHNWQVHTVFPDFNPHSRIRQYHYANWPYYKLPRNNERWGYIDKAGEFVIEPRFKTFDLASWGNYPLKSFSEGLAPAYDGSAWGYIDKTGEYVIQPQFEHAAPFSEGLAIADISYKSGIIDKTGKFILEPKYSRIESFSQGRAYFTVDYNYDYKYGYLDTEGNVVIEPKYESGRPFSQGLASVKLDDKAMLIDLDGNVIVKTDFSGIGKFSQGLASFGKDGKSGYIDTSGQVVIDNKYDYAFGFKNGYAYIRLNDKGGLIDRAGNVVKGSKYEIEGYFINDIFLAAPNNRIILVDQSGNVIKRTNWMELGDLQDGLAYYTDGRKYGFVNESGEIVIKAKYNVAYGFTESLAVVSILQNAIPFWLAYAAVVAIGILLFVAHKIIKKNRYTTKARTDKT